MHDNKANNFKGEAPADGTGTNVTVPLLVESSEENSDEVTKSTVDSCTKEEATVNRTTQDTRWSWVVAFAAFMTHFMIDGCIASFGIYYPVLLKEFGAGPAVTSFAGSMVVGVYLMTSPLVGMAVRKYNCRVVGFVGGCVAVMGLLISLSGTIVVFMLGYGIIAGFGIGMNAMPAMIMINEYFHEKRGIGQGILFAGAGCGVLVLAPVSQVLLQEYGRKGAFLITGGLLLHFCVFSLLMRPLQHEKKQSRVITAHRHDDSVRNDQQLNTTALHTGLLTAKQNEISGIALSDNNLFQNGRAKLHNTTFTSVPDLTKHSKKHSTLHEHRHYSSLLKNSGILLSNGMLCGSVYGSKRIASDRQDTEEYSENIYNECVEQNKPKARFCDPSILRHPVYIPILLGGVLLQMAQFIPTTYIPDYCETIGLGGQSASIIIAIFGAFSVAGRLSSGCLANVNSISSLWMFNMAMLVCGISCFLFPLCRTFPTLCIYAMALGFFMGFSPPLQVLILVEYLGIDNFSASMGFLQMSKGPAALVGPPFAGIVYEWTGDYAISIVFAAVLYVLATGIQSLVPLIDRCKAKEKPDHLTNKTIRITET